MKSVEGTLKNILLAGIGTVSYSYEKGRDLVDEMVKKGELTIQEGEALDWELKRYFKKEGPKEAATSWFEDTINRILEEMHVASKEEMNELKDQVVSLETRISILEKQLETVQKTDD